MSCEIEAWDGDPCEFHKSTIRTAKKEHICGECDRKIHPGEKYEYISAKYDGEIFSVTTCIDCLSLRKTFFCSFLYGAIWEYFWEEFKDWWFRDGRELWKLESLTPAARKKILDVVSIWEAEEAEEELCDE